MKKEPKWNYAISEFKYHGCFLNPDKLPKEIRKKYRDTLDKFFETFAEIIKIHTDNPEVSSKAYDEVFGRRK